VQNVVAFQRLTKLRGSRRGEQDDVSVTAFGFDAARRLMEGLGGRLELRPDTEGHGGVVDMKVPSGE
jgi:hypothetical protein